MAAEPGRDWLLNFHDKELLKPVHPSSEPGSDFVDWHRNEVFKGNPF